MWRHTLYQKIYILSAVFFTFRHQLNTMAYNSDNILEGADMGVSQDCNYPLRYEISEYDGKSLALTVNIVRLSHERGIRKRQKTVGDMLQTFRSNICQGWMNLSSFSLFLATSHTHSLFFSITLLWITSLFEEKRSWVPPNKLTNLNWASADKE